MKYLLLIFSLFFICSCETQESVTEGVGYFDIESYIKELPSSETTQTDVSKTVTLNGTTERKQLGNYNITPELNMMNKYNINKPALSGKYTEKKEGNKTIYTAVEEDLITRTLTIERKNNDISSIHINGLQKSILSQSQQTITFVPEKSFLLKSEDQNRFTKDITKEVLIEY